MPELLYKEKTHKIIGATIEVHKTLGHGFLEPIYQEALAYEFNLSRIPYEKEKPLKIYYKDIILEKSYIADFVCYDKIIVECKAVEKLISEHESQVLNYLHPV